MNKEQSWTPARIIYAVLMSGLLLGYLAVIATYKDYTTSGQDFYYPGFVWIVRVITVVMAVILGKLWKDKGFWILMAYLLLKAVRVAIPDPQNLFEYTVSDNLMTGLWIFCACYGLGRVFSKEQLKKLLGFNAVIWTVGMIVYSCLGIYAAWTWTPIYTIGKGAAWCIQDNRLFLVYFVTISGAVLSISIIIALCYAITVKNRAAKAFFFLSLIPMIIALSLTDSRCAQITVATGTAALIGIYVLDKLLYNDSAITKKPLRAWAFALASAGVVFVAVVFVTMKTINVFNHVRVTGLLISRALADNTGNVISNRGYLGSNPLTSRPMIWESAIRAFKNNPAYLLYGASILNPMKEVNASPTMTFHASHCHCMPLMILLENGIPGVLLIGSFLTTVISRALCLVKKTALFWIKGTAAIALSVTIGELIECFTWLRSGQAPILPFYFVALGIISAAESGRKTAEQQIEMTESCNEVTANAD